MVQRSVKGWRGSNDCRRIGIGIGRWKRMGRWKRRVEGERRGSGRYVGEVYRRNIKE